MARARCRRSAQYHTSLVWAQPDHCFLNYLPQNFIFCEALTIAHLQLRLNPFFTIETNSTIELYGTE